MRPFIELSGGLLVGILIASVTVASPPPFRITIEGWAPYFSPKSAVVPMYTPIRWENPTATHHTITHDNCGKPNGACAFDSGPVPPDGVYELPGLEPGEYPYHCTLHPIMRGILVVTKGTMATKI
ncbi:MAG: hypothetical protein D6704_06160 [Nitrospirae bacterium]|nr:MAG: hypothetical protein D6704_06160 [Nitrospirota bacterium]